MLDDVLPLLVCPHCRGGLAVAGRVLACSSGHTFDIARQGYVNLSVGRGGGDTAAMVAARDRFLSTGHYLPVADAVAEAVLPAPGPLLDLGAGTGWYLAHALHRREQAGGPTSGVAVDLSVYAARRAARCHPRAGAVVFDTWGTWPVADACVGAVIDVFAPRNAAELRRVVARDGLLVVVTPRPEHLAELRRPLGLLGVEQGKQERLAAELDEGFEPVGEQAVVATMTLGRDAVRDVVSMGPSAWHDQAGGRESAVAGLPEAVEVTLAVRVSVHRRR